MAQEIEILKKGYEHICSKIDNQELIDMISTESENYPTKILCQILDIPKSTYYQSFNKKSNMYQQANEHLLKQIRQIFVDSKGILVCQKFGKNY